MTATTMTLEESRASGWKFYHEALKGRSYPTHPHHAPIGFFRVWDRHKTKSWPLAIWEADGKRYAQVGNAAILDLSTPAAEEDFIDKTFQWCSRNAIPHPVYLHWMEHREWPPETGAAAAITASKRVAAKAEESPAPRTEPAGIGDNSGADPAIEHEMFLDQAKAALSGVPAAKVATDDDLPAANGLRNRLTELASEGDKKRVVEKEPHLAASRAVDARWNPSIKELKDGAASIKRVIEAHENAKLKKRREEEAARAAMSNPVTEPVAPQRIESTHGKKSTVKTRKEVVVVDQDALYQALKGNTDVQVLLKKLAQRVVDAGSILPGCQTTEVASIR